MAREGGLGEGLLANGPPAEIEMAELGPAFTVGPFQLALKTMFGETVSVASERFCAWVGAGAVERRYTPPRGGHGPPSRKCPRQPP